MPLLGYLMAIAAIDGLNPTATALQFYLLTTPQPVAPSIPFSSSVL